MATPKKLPSGRWRVQVFAYTDAAGKNHYKSFTADTKAECAELERAFKSAKKREEITSKTPTVRRAIEDYILINKEVLSPTTIYGYETTLKHGFPDLMEIDICSLTKRRAQEEINAEMRRLSSNGKPYSPKTIKNRWGLISAALREHGISFDVKLPKLPRKNIELPSPEEVGKIFKGTDLELPVLLAMWLSFTVSEIRGLMCSSVSAKYIKIDQVKSYTGKEVVKDMAKTNLRNRQIPTPAYIWDLIQSLGNYKKYEESGEDGYLVPYTYGYIAYNFRKVTTEHNIDMSFHQLRHLNASVMLSLGIPEKYAMERGGWATPHIMRTVYQHTMTDKRQEVTNRIDNYFDTIMDE